MARVSKAASAAAATTSDLEVVATVTLIVGSGLAPAQVAPGAAVRLPVAEARRLIAAGFATEVVDGPTLVDDDHEDDDDEGGEGGGDEDEGDEGDASATGLALE
jgi:hypothetical protein